jgi:two-component system response regulator
MMYEWFVHFFQRHGGIMEQYKQSFRVLLVEDNPDEALLTQIALQKSDINCSIDHISSAADAWEFLVGIDQRLKVQKKLPNLILLDLKIPGMNGIELLQRIRSNQHLDSLPVIMLTNSTYAGDLQACYGARCNAYLVKPTHIVELRQLLNNTLRFWSNVHQDIGSEMLANM